MIGFAERFGVRVMWAVLALGTSFLAACDMDGPDPGRVLNRRMGFWITPPEGWRIDLESGRLNPARLRSPDDSAVVNVSLIATEEGDSAKEHALRGYDEFNPLVRIVEQGDAPLAGRTAYRTVTRDEQSGEPKIILRYIFPDGPRYYDITCTCLEKDYEAQGPVFEKICASFTFKPKE